MRPLGERQVLQRDLKAHGRPTSRDNDCTSTVPATNGANTRLTIRMSFIMLMALHDP